MGGKELKMLNGLIHFSQEQISCQFLHHPQSEDIGLKSSLEREKGVLLSTGSNLRQDTPR